MDEIVHPKGKIYYTMGEVTEMFGVNASLLRYWEQEFEMLRPHRNKKGNRLYTPQDVDTIRTIYHLLKEKKMKIEVARRQLKSNKEEINRDALIVEKLMSIRAILQEIKNDLTYDGQVVDTDFYDQPEESIATPWTEATPRDNDTHAAAVGQKPAETLAVSEDKEDDNTPDTNGNGSDPTPPPFEEQMLFKIRETGIETIVVRPAEQDDINAWEDDMDTDEIEDDTEETKPYAIEQTLF